MLVEDLRLSVFSAVLSELYRKCGLFPSTKNNTTAEVCETEFGTSIYGYEFNLVLNTKKTNDNINEIVVCDICFSTPTTEFIDSFAEKLRRTKEACPINLIGIIAFTEDLSATIAKYANELSVYTLSYFNNPNIKPLLNELNLLCYKYTYSDSLKDNLISLRHEIAGYLQNYSPLRLLQIKPYFVDGFQACFMRIKSHTISNNLGFFAVTSGGFLIHLQGSDNFAFYKTAKFFTKTNKNCRYKQLRCEGSSSALDFTLPTAISKDTLFSDGNYLTVNTFLNNRAFSFKLTIQL